MSKTKTKVKAKPPIKKVSLVTGVIFVGIGILNLILVIFSSDPSTKATYAGLVASFITLGLTLLDKSKVFER